MKTHSPDLLTLDLHLSDTSGLEVLKKLRELGTKTKILVLTSEESLPVLLQILRHRADAILLKTYTIPMFEAAVAHLEHDNSEQTYVDPSLEKHFSLELTKPQLSVREFDVLQYLLKGHTNKSIAEILKCSPETIKTYRSRIMEKTDTKNRSEMAQWFHRGIVN